MRTVGIRLHRINGVGAPALDQASLAAAFENTDVRLTILAGSTLPADPALQPGFNYRNLVSAFRAEDSSSGHLVIGGIHPSRNLNIAGELADLESRGIAVVFAGSDYVTRHGRDGLLQTTAHELGHLLNLGHEHNGRDYDSIMDQARDRDQDPAICWRFARAEAEQAASTGSPSYWLEPSVPPSCHPFGRSARIRLAHLSDEKFLPWRTGFEPNYGGAEDRWSLSEALRVDLEARTFRRNGVLAFVVSYENRRQDLIAAPPELGPAFQTLIVQIRRPDGDVYQHRPRALNCSTGLEPLRPGGRLQWPFCTMRGPGGFALGQVGVYELVVIAPRLGAASAPVQFEVVEPSQAGPKAPPVPRALAGTPASARSEARLRREIASRLGRRDIDPLTRGYLALTQIGFETDPAKIVKLESQALAPTSPTEVRHAAALARFKRLAAAGRLGRRARNDLCRRHLQRPEDQALSTRLCEEPL